MALCEKCLFYNKEYDDFNRDYDDTIIIGDSYKPHFCTQYFDGIPRSIFEENADCEFHQPKTEE